MMCWIYNRRNEENLIPEKKEEIKSIGDKKKTQEHKIEREERITNIQTKNINEKKEKQRR